MVTIKIYIPVTYCFMGCLGKKKKRGGRKKGAGGAAATTTGEEKCNLNWRKASDPHAKCWHPLLNYSGGLTKSSHWLFVMEKAPPSCWSWAMIPPSLSPFSLNPSFFFPPLPSARQQFIYIIVYADSFLPPPRTHNDFSCWCFPFFSFSLAVFLPSSW